MREKKKVRKIRLKESNSSDHLISISCARIVSGLRNHPRARGQAQRRVGCQHSNGNILSAMRLANMTYYLRSVKFQRLLTR